MARYRKVDVRLWGDAKFRGLSPLAPSGQALWLYLLTAHESTSVPGMLVAGALGLAERLGWPEEAFFLAWAEVEEARMARADWGAPLIWLPNAIRYNRPPNPSVILAWARHWGEVPECDLKREAREVLRLFLEASGTAYSRAFAQACPPHARAHAQAQGRKRAASEGKERGEHQAPGNGALAREAAAPESSIRPRRGGMGIDEHEVSSEQTAPSTPEPDQQDQDQDQIPPLIPPSNDASPFVAWAHEHYPDIRDPARIERVALAAYPGVDLLASARMALAWETADPKRRKVSHGRFLNSWWATAAKDLRAAQPPPPPARPQPPPAGCREWQLVREVAAKRLRPDLFDRWFAPLSASCDGSTLMLKAPDPYAAAFVRDNYADWLASVSAEVLPAPLSVEVAP